MKGNEKDILLQANGKQAEEETTKLKGVIEKARRGRVDMFLWSLLQKNNQKKCSKYLLRR